MNTALAHSQREFIYILWERFGKFLVFALSKSEQILGEFFKKIYPSLFFC